MVNCFTIPFTLKTLLNSKLVYSPLPPIVKSKIFSVLNPSLNQHLRELMKVRLGAEKLVNRSWDFGLLLGANEKRFKVGIRC